MGLCGAGDGVGGEEWVGGVAREGLRRDTMEGRGATRANTVHWTLGSMGWLICDGLGTDADVSRAAKSALYCVLAYFRLSLSMTTAHAGAPKPETLF